MQSLRASGTQNSIVVPNTNIKGDSIPGMRKSLVFSKIQSFEHLSYMAKPPACSGRTSWSCSFWASELYGPHKNHQPALEGQASASFEHLSYMDLTKTVSLLWEDKLILFFVASRQGQGGTYHHIRVSQSHNSIKLENKNRYRKIWCECQWDNSPSK